ncbi:hypothetical protein ES703_61498 [subsurface metagenome]
MNNQEYDVTFGGYYWRGKQNFEAYSKLGAKTNLFYSALEYRSCIERLLFEHLALLNLSDLPKKFLKLYRAKDLRYAILDIEPEFLRKLEYINIMFEAIGVSNRVFIPDLDNLNGFYGRLGDYLHALKEPGETVDRNEWWDGFLKIIEQVDTYLQGVSGHDFGSFKLNDRGLETFEQWKNGKLSNSELVHKIRTEYRVQ